MMRCAEPLPAAMEEMFLLKLRKRSAGRPCSCGWCSSTLPPLVAQQSVGVLPSKRPITTRPGSSGWPRLIEKDGLSMAAVIDLCYQR